MDTTNPLYAVRKTHNEKTDVLVFVVQVWILLVRFFDPFFHHRSQAPTRFHIPRHSLEIGGKLDDAGVFLDGGVACGSISRVSLRIQRAFEMPNSHVDLRSNGVLLSIAAVIMYVRNVGFVHAPANRLRGGDGEIVGIYCFLTMLYAQPNIIYASLD